MTRFSAAIAFYTTLPIPGNWGQEVATVSRFVVLVGIGIGGLLGLLDQGLTLLHMPILTRSGVLVITWIGITGGLHLDGAMDTADGLAVQDPQRRLEVMADSATGAFGAMAAIALVLLKTVALTELSTNRWLGVILAAAWGRWAQQIAILRYPYLKPTGKGAFHKTALRCRDVILSLVILVSFSGLPWLISEPWWFSVAIGVGGGAIALFLPVWFNHRLGGHTGDTYGAVVEWTEALFLTALTVIKT